MAEQPSTVGLADVHRVAAVQAFWFSAGMPVGRGTLLQIDISHVELALRRCSPGTYVQTTAQPPQHLLHQRLPRSRPLQAQAPLPYLLAPSSDSRASILRCYSVSINVRFIFSVLAGNIWTPASYLAYVVWPLTVSKAKSKRQRYDALS